MRVTTFLSASAALVTFLASAAPVPESGANAERGLLDSIAGLFESCPAYDAADKVDISARDIEVMEKRAGEEFWFRFEDSNVVKGTILQLAPHAKNFDDQAYKWISSDISKVTRGSIKGRVPTLFVLPAGTRAQINAAAQKFEDTSAKQVPADFVTKDNEPNDIGINGVAKNAAGVLPLDDFRSKVIRTVVKQTSAKAKGKATFTTINKGKSPSSTASRDDQKLLASFC